MNTTEKTYPILEGLLDVFGNWLRHRREIRELHQLYCGTKSRPICASRLQTSMRGQGRLRLTNCPGY